MVTLLYTAAAAQATLAARYDLLQKLLTVTRTQPMAPPERMPLASAEAIPTPQAEVSALESPVGAVVYVHIMSLTSVLRHLHAPCLCCTSILALISPYLTRA